MRGNIYDRLSERRKSEERLKQERLDVEVLCPAPQPQERFLANEISFVRPSDLKDKTFHVFAFADEGPSSLSVVIGRSRVANDTALEVLTQQLLADLNRSLSHLQWIDYPAPAKIAGVEARRLEYKWRQQGRLVHQIQFLFIAQDECGFDLLMQVTATSNDPKGMPLKERELFGSIVDSLQIRGVHDFSLAAITDE
ncbi:DcrB-related protein [Pseudomonas putida]|uniref:Cytoplasmic protein n=1 Tax=Pseudomonas putida TaxID=303 RepID=A0A1X0ZTF0_PSEPU|nr:DcrB-related protein [Pseudomonas putida]ORL62995.1 cytoplasmic protein [Pseudomonas putida]